MSRLVPAILVALAVAGAPAAAIAAENLQTFRDVQRQVLGYAHFTIFDSVHADVDDGHVTLVGKVTMPYKRAAIERRVRALDSVETIDNRIEVLPASRFDDTLRFGIARALYGSQHFQRYATMVNPPIHVIVERGRVTLEGVVQSPVDRLIAQSIAGSFNAFELTIDLKTEEEIESALEHL